MGHICKNENVNVSKNERELTITDHTNTFKSKNLSTLSNQIFLWIAKKAIYSFSVGQVSALCATYCIGYVLKPIDSGLEYGQFFGLT